MTSSVLIKLNDEYYIKSDRHSFSMCLDRGDRKFPGGIVSRYFEPITWHGSISEMEYTINRKEINPNPEYLNFADMEKEFFQFCANVDEEFKSEISIANFEIVFDKDSIVLKDGKKNLSYHNKIGQAIKNAYIMKLRVSETNSWEKATDILNIVHKQAKEIVDKLKEINKNYEGKDKP